MTLRASRDRERDTVTVEVTHGPVAFRAEEAAGDALEFWHRLGALLVEDAEDRARKGYCRFHEVAGTPHHPWEALSPAARAPWIAAFTE